MDVQTIGVLVAASSVTTAAIYYVLTLKYSRRTQELALKAQQQALETRQAQLFIDVYKTDESSEFQTIWWETYRTWAWKDYDDFMKKYSVLGGNYISYGKLLSIFSHFEGMGVLMRRGLLSPEIIYELNYNGIIMFWDKFSPIVHEWRRRFNSPQMFGTLEWLHGEMKKIRESKGHGFDYIPPGQTASG